MDLHTILQREGRLKPEQAVGWVLRLAQALEVIHGRGLAHGCLCPQAIETEGPGCDAPASLKSPDELIELPAYRSADRREGPPSPADDVWAAGVILYQLVTGVVPFRGDSIGQVRARIGWSPPTPIHKRGCGSRSLHKLLKQLFSPYRVDRVIVARDLRIRLERLGKAPADLPPLSVPDETIVGSRSVAMSSRPPPPMSVSPSVPPPGSMPPPGSIPPPSVPSAPPPPSFPSSPPPSFPGPEPSVPSAPSSISTLDSSADRPSGDPTSAISRSGIVDHTWPGVGAASRREESVESIVDGEGPTQIYHGGTLRSVLEPDDEDDEDDQRPTQIFESAKPQPSEPPSDDASDDGSDDASDDGSDDGSHDGSEDVTTEVSLEAMRKASRKPASDQAGSEDVTTEARLEVMHEASREPAAAEPPSPEKSAKPALTDDRADKSDSALMFDVPDDGYVHSEKSLSQKTLAAWLEDKELTDAPDVEWAESSESALNDWLGEEGPLSKDVIEELSQQPAPSSAPPAEAPDAPPSDAPPADAPASDAGPSQGSEGEAPAEQAPTPEKKRAKKKSKKKKKKRKSRATPAPARPAPDARIVRSTAPPPASSSSSRTLWMILGLVALAGVLAWLVRGRGSSTPTPQRTPVAPSAARAALSAAPVIAATAPRPASTPMPTARASVAASAPTAPGDTPAAVPVGDVASCVATMMPAGAFGDEPPKLASMCSQDDPVKGAQLLRRAVVLAGRGRDLTDAMVEWSQLAWYEMAAFVAIRARCCSHPPPLIKEGSYALCGIHSALVELETAVASRDTDGMTSATEHYHKAVKCLWRGDHAGRFSQSAKPHVQHRALFQNILARVK